jgi:hypothetical protein
MDHRLELDRRKGLRPANEGGEKARGGIACSPELNRELMLCLESLGERAKMGEVHTMIVTTAFVCLAHLRVFERGELAQDFFDCRAR